MLRFLLSLVFLEALSTTIQVPDAEPAAHRHSEVGALLQPSSRPKTKSQINMTKFKGYVVNLDSKRNRLDSFTQHLADTKIPDFQQKFCRLSAVTPEKLPEFLSHQPLIDGIIDRTVASCWASHWSALRMIAADPDHDFGIIAEDDLSMYSDDFALQMQRLVANVADLTSMFVLLQHGAGAKWRKGGKRQDGETFLVPAAPLRGTGMLMNNGMYAVGRNTAAYLAGIGSDSGAIGNMSAEPRGIDFLMPGSLLDTTFEFLVFDPPIAQCGGFDSNVNHSLSSLSYVQSESHQRLPDCAPLSAAPLSAAPLRK